jgi:hypothetical protein
MRKPQHSLTIAFNLSQHFRIFLLSRWSRLAPCKVFSKVRAAEIIVCILQQPVRVRVVVAPHYRGARGVKHLRDQWDRWQVIQVAFVPWHVIVAAQRGHVHKLNRRTLAAVCSLALALADAWIPPPCPVVTVLVVTKTVCPEWAVSDPSGFKDGRCDGRNGDVFPSVRRGVAAEGRAARSAGGGVRGGGSWRGWGGFGFRAWLSGLDGGRGAHFEDVVFVFVVFIALVLIWFGFWGWWPVPAPPCLLLHWVLVLLILFVPTDPGID